MAFTEDLSVFFQSADFATSATYKAGGVGGGTAILVIFDQANQEHLGITDDLRIMDAVQQLARPCEKVLERFHVDTRYIAAGAAAGPLSSRPRTSTSTACPRSRASRSPTT